MTCGCSENHDKQEKSDKLLQSYGNVPVGREELRKSKINLKSSNHGTEKVVLVCSGTGCTSSGSAQLAETFRDELAKVGLDGKVKVKRTGCPGFCENGPIVQVKPEGVFYTGVNLADVKDIVQSHLTEGKVVDRLLFRDAASGQVFKELKEIPFYAGQLRVESCGKCTPCREGTKRTLEILERIRSGQADMTDLSNLERLRRVVQNTALCGLGQAYPNPVLSTLAECGQQISYTIEAELCKGCGLCVRKCPVEAIYGERKLPHTINAQQCIKCGACHSACEFKAVTRFQEVKGHITNITLTIDNHVITITQGTTILDAARQLGIEIPTFCHDPELTPYGACRICVVEVEGWTALLASCVTEARQDMVVYTESARVVEARRTILELMLANHPMDCLTCEKTGDCRLQDYTYRYDIAPAAFQGEKNCYSIEQDNPFILRDMNKCILCGKCVRVCSEVAGRSAVDFTFRGFKAKVSTPLDLGLKESDCVFCGSCLEVCPVGALTERQMLGLGRKWQYRPVTTTCPYCGVGCQLNLLVKDNEVIGIKAAGTGINGKHLCAKGRFAYKFINHPERLRAPLVRKDGQLTEVCWEEALDYTAEKLRAIKENHGSEALGILASARISNEENYLLNKLGRAVLGTNNIDHCARL